MPSRSRRSPSASATISKALAVTWQLVFERILVRASDPDAAVKVAGRLEEEISRPLDLTVRGPYWKNPALFELQATTELDETTFAAATVEALDLLGRFITGLQDVRVRAAEESARALFSAAANDPIGTTIAGLSWLSVEISRTD